MVAVCGWHWKFWGYPKLLRVVSWRGWCVTVSHGLCRRCRVELRKEVAA